MKVKHMPVGYVFSLYNEEYVRIPEMILSDSQFTFIVNALLVTHSDEQIAPSRTAVFFQPDTEEDEGEGDPTERYRYETRSCIEQDVEAEKENSDLFAIAGRLTNIAREDLTTAEKQIVSILMTSGHLTYDADDQLTRGDAK